LIASKNLTISHETVILIFMGIILILIAGLRPLEYFADASNYLNKIYNNGGIFDTEPTFWLINQFNQLLLGGKEQIFFLIYAALGVSIKILAIKKLSLVPLLSIYLYICLYFLLHEMAQIRVGVASAVFLLAIPDIVNKNFKNYLLKTVIAIAFHYSALIMIVFYFISFKKINKNIYYSLPIFGLVLALAPNFIFSILTFSASILPSMLSNKIIMYLNFLKDGIHSDIHIFNIYIVSLLIIYYFSLFNLKKFESKLNTLLVKFLGLQLFIFFAFSCMPVFAWRLSEFIGISLMILIPHLIFIFKQKIFPIMFIIVWGGVYFWYVNVNLNLIVKF
jgi:hypothetical protein